MIRKIRIFLKTKWISVNNWESTKPLIKRVTIKQYIYSNVFPEDQVLEDIVSLFETDNDHL